MFSPCCLVYRVSLSPLGFVLLKYPSHSNVHLQPHSAITSASSRGRKVYISVGTHCFTSYSWIACSGSF